MSRWTDEPMNRSFHLFYITDRTQIKSTTLAATIAQAIAAGVGTRVALGGVRDR